MDNSLLKVFRMLGLALSLGVTSSAFGFELLSEGAMDSVSAVSADSAQDIVNVVGSSAAGLRVDDGYYEDLPLVDRQKTPDYSTEDQSEELSRNLTLEVETWADNLRQTTAINFEIGFVDQLPAVTSTVETYQAPVFVETIPVDVDAFVISADSQTVYQVGRIEQVFELLDSGVNSISYSLRRQIESVSTVNARPDDDGDYMGSGFISNLVSDSRIRFSQER